VPMTPGYNFPESAVFTFANQNMENQQKKSRYNKSGQKELA